jgi:glucan biosynthesis protein C
MSEGRSFARRHDLDFIRVVAVFLAIVFHTSIIFGTSPWLINAPYPLRNFDLISLALHPWRLSILFLISGIATASLASQMPPVEIRSLRTRQLVPALLFGTFVVVPPQMFVALGGHLGSRMSYLKFWTAYLRFATITDQSGVEVPVVTMQHLWYLAYLWFYATVLMLVVEFSPELPKLLKTGLSASFQGGGALIWPAIYLAVLRLALYPLFGETLIVQTDWYSHAAYFSIFVFGFLIVEDDGFWNAAVALRRQAVVVAGISLLLIILLFEMNPAEGKEPSSLAIYQIGRSIFQWSTILAILAYCKVIIAKPHPVLTYLNKGVLTYYVLHQTVLILLAFWLKKTYGLNSWSFVVIVVMTTACCLAAYEIQRRLFQFFRATAIGQSFLSAKYVIKSEDEADLVDQADADENSLETPVGGEGRDDAKHYEGRIADRVLPA